MNLTNVAVACKSEESYCVCVLALLSQEEVPADSPLHSGLLRLELGGRGRFLRLQYRLHPQREPPTDLQLLNSTAPPRHQEAYKKILSPGVAEMY